jgi:co-chaperonin GroES (HSP10)
MNFKPYFDKIVIKPFKADTFFDDEKLQEVGEVIAVGELVKFAKVGDTIYFNAEGVRKTQKINENDEQYYIVQEAPEFILGIKSDG